MKTRFKSYAKINTSLEVVNYLKKYKKHKIKSNISILKLSDKIYVTNSKKTKILYIDGNTKKKLKIRNDIISKTINFFDSKYSTKTNLSIKVVKFIPIGYGFGGGSSNASTILKYLYSYHSISDINFNHDAHIIGSDVSLFKDLFPKEIDGISIIKKKIKRRYTWKKIYLLLPSKKNSTKKIFSLYKNKKTVPKKSFIYENLNKSMIKKNIFLAKNDLIICASHYNREMSKILIYLYQNNGLFSKFGMTGTGSGLFIIFKDKSYNKSFFNEFKKLFPLASIEKSEYFS